jgi:hypothetical protein
LSHWHLDPNVVDDARALHIKERLPLPILNDEAVAVSPGPDVTACIFGITAVSRTWGQ